MRRLVALFALSLAAGCGPAGLDFGPKFLWGAATSAHQIEGNDTDSDIWAWEQAGNTLEKAGLADDSYRRFTEDSRLLTEAGLNAYRFSLDWSRLEPSPGQWNDEAEAHYHALLDDLKARGIRPMVTLHHFSAPRWLNDFARPPGGIDGWADPRAADAFESFARHAATAFGGQVDLWLTFNEPMVYALGAYAEGHFPPGTHQMDLTEKLLPTVLPNLIDAHVRAARAIHEADTVDADGDGSAARVGIAQDIVPLHPATGADRAGTARYDSFYNHLFLRAAAQGAYDATLSGDGPVDHPEWAGSLDFVGINYYTAVAFVSAQAFHPVEGLPCDGSLETATGLPLEALGCPAIKGERSDQGQEIVPDGLREAVTAVWQAYGLPIFITENGVATLDDDLRSRHLAAHLKALHAAMAAGARVEGYFYWSLLDNFEWGSFAPRYGLYRVDYANDFARSPTGAVPLLRRTARASLLSDQDVRELAP